MKPPKPFSTVPQALTFVVVWAAIGAVIVFELGVHPKSAQGWVFWVIVAPLLYLVGEVVFEPVVSLVARIPPLPWLRSWVAGGVDSEDRIIRVVILAAVFLVLFFVGLKIYSHILGL